MGFMEVGPHYYPPRPYGAQVIQRGPHGMRFAGGPQRDPVTGKFRWWHEQALQAGEYRHFWQPQQQVVGVMGLGNLPVVSTGPAQGFSGLGQTTPARLAKASAIRAAIVKARPLAPLAAQAGGTALSALESVIAQAARQNETGANEAFSRAVAENQKVLREGARLGPQGGPVMALYGEVMGGIAEAGRVMQLHFARTEAEQAEYMKGVNAAERAHQQYRNYSDVPRDVTRDLEEAIGRSLDDVERAVTGARSTTVDWIAANWWKPVLLVGGLILGGSVLYGASSGFGRGLAARRR